uniref:Uncharacterized protein n=1 Tax=Panagrolaimus superbus TaxID=310955 RepID=A0A914Y7J8_9BILA
MRFGWEDGTALVVVGGTVVEAEKDSKRGGVIGATVLTIFDCQTIVVGGIVVGLGVVEGLVLSKRIGTKVLTTLGISTLLGGCVGTQGFCG